MAALGILLATMLPYLHSVVSDQEGNPRKWVPNIGFVKNFTSTDGKILGYSTYEVFVYMASVNFSYMFAWLCALHFAQNRPYRFVLFFPAALSTYQFLIVIFNLRETQLNELSTKIVIVLIVALIIIINYFFNRTNERNTY
jgi:hypothetical protein